MEKDNVFFKNTEWTYSVLISQHNQMMVKDRYYRGKPFFDKYPNMELTKDWPQRLQIDEFTIEKIKVLRSRLVAFKERKCTWIKHYYETNKTEILKSLQHAIERNTEDNPDMVNTKWLLLPQHYTEMFCSLFIGLRTGEDEHGSTLIIEKATVSVAPFDTQPVFGCQIYEPIVKPLTDVKLSFGHKDDGSFFIDNTVFYVSLGEPESCIDRDFDFMSFLTTEEEGEIKAAFESVIG